MSLKVDPFIQIKNVSHTFSDGINAIANVNLEIGRGSFVSLVGSSGVGKSTLLRIVAGLLVPSSGSVALDGSSPGKTEEAVGIVFQRDNLMAWRTVADNIRLPLEIHSNGEIDPQGRLQELIELVGLQGFEDSYPSQLSGGMAQRVALARALVHQPSLLLLDEPFGALDAITRERMSQELLVIWRAMPVTVFMVTHSISEALWLSDVVAVMSGRPGHISELVEVPLGRPRMLAMQESAVFLQLVKKIRSQIDK